MQVTVEQAIKTLKALQGLRNSIVENISYATQISGEDTDLYIKQLLNADKSIEKLLESINMYEIKS